MSHNLRKKIRVSYYEPDEPSLDDYVYCEGCGDYVYEYCSIHGPLLVIPDNEIPLKPDFPEVVPRAALTIPHVFLHLAPSIIPGGGIGVFTTLTLPRGVRFGPYRGLRSDIVDSTYCWQVYDNNNKPSYVIDATDVARSNWMRYVNCARHWSEQNLVAYQYRGQIYYRTIRIIPRFTELMVFYGSEFANVLGIDLRKYNDKKYYQTILSNTFNTKTQKVKTKMPEINTHSAVNNITTLKIEKIGEIISECSDSTSYSGNITEVNSVVSANTVKAERTDVNESATAHSEFNSNILDSTTSAPRCEICLKLFKEARYLRRHVKEVHGLRRYSCNDCDYKSNSKRNLTKHILRASCSKQMGDTGTDKDIVGTTSAPRCEVCLKLFKEARYLRQHVKEVHGHRRYSCNDCDYKSNSKRNLTKHILRASCSKQMGDNGTDKDTVGTCNICHKTFIKLRYLKRHIDIFHLNFQRYFCNLCEFKTNYHYNLTKHRFNIHSITPKYTCKSCGFKADNEEFYNLHTKKHAPKRRTHKTHYNQPRACDVCDFITDSRKLYKYHKAKHEGKIFKCTVCDYASYEKWNLTRHIKNNGH